MVRYQHIRLQLPMKIRESPGPIVRTPEHVADQCRDMLPLAQEARHVEMLMVQMKMEPDRIAAALGKTTSWVALRARMMKIIPKLKPLLEKYNAPGHWELIARLSPEAQEQILNNELRWNQEHFFRRPVAELRKMLANEYLLSLDPKKIPWALDDETLVPKCGACSKCPHRTSQNALLFPEMAKTKDDMCLKADCYTAKMSAANVLRLAKLKEKHPDIVAITTDDEKAEREKITHLDEWDLKQLKVAAGSKGAKPVFNTDTGQVLYVKPEKGTTAAKQMAKKSEGPKKKKPLSERLALHEAKRWKHVSGQLQTILQDKKIKWPSNRKPLDAFRLTLCGGLEFGSPDYDQMWEEIDNPDFDIGKAWSEEWENVDGRNVRHQVSKSVNFDYYMLEDIVKNKMDVRLQRCALFFNIDLNELKNKADFDLPLPKALAADVAAGAVEKRKK